jgi:hypothetical protein
MSFAFWCRKANLASMQSAFNDDKPRVGLGTVFHITPSNVPTNFAYSFAFGLISGNANIVKVPSKAFPQIQIICDGINTLFDTKQFVSIKASTVFVRYDKDDQYTAYFSKQCNARLVWGGDLTVENIRKHPLPTRSIDIAFSDRYSISLIYGPAINQLEKSELRRLAERFYNDTYLMDQNACSSPHLVVWLNDKDGKYKSKFWEELYTVTKEKYELTESKSVAKFNQLCKTIIENDNLGSFENHGNYIYRMSIHKLMDNTDALRGTCGYFFEYDTEDLDDLLGIINSKYQTVTYFGFDKSILRDFVINNSLLGVDRIVPVGAALEMGAVWDGYDIVRTLSRVIDVL